MTLSSVKMNIDRDFLRDLMGSVTDRCIICGADIFDNFTGFCQHCIKDVVFNNGKTCLRCGVRITGEENYCSNCVSGEMWFDRAYSAFSYEGNIVKAIHSLKFGNMAGYAKVLAGYLAYIAVGKNIPFDVVCYVPMTERAEKLRRYNQSQSLSQYFCDILSKDRPLPLLVKVRETQRQEQLDKYSRLRNLDNAFKADKNYDIKNKTVLVIDDVKTTGTTLEQCARALKKAGASRVYCLTVASREEKVLVQ